jgi:hypothetical protein
MHTGKQMDTNNIFFESVSNSSPTCTIDEEAEEEEDGGSYACSPNQSMVTYKTNYVKEPVDQKSSSSIDQQSTPYLNGEAAAAKVRKLRLSTGASNGGVQQRSMRKSLTSNFCRLVDGGRRRSRTNDTSLSSYSSDSPVKTEPASAGIENATGGIEQAPNARMSRKCRRSNTTYTVAGGNNRNSKIIDYFTKYA